MTYKERVDLDYPNSNYSFDCMIKLGCPSDYGYEQAPGEKLGVCVRMIDDCKLLMCEPEDLEGLMTCRECWGRNYKKEEKPNEGHL